MFFFFSQKETKLTSETKELRQKLESWTSLSKEKDEQLQKMEAVILKAEKNLKVQVLYIMHL